MRVPPHELGAHRLEGIANLEGSLLVRHLGQEHRLEHEVADLLPERREVAPVDGVDHLVGLFEHEGTQRCEGLLAVPGAAAGRPQGPHDLDEAIEGGAGGRSVGVAR